uniref:Uncharacterized protein n=1 Tax=Anguilla anguilla TaxID=7936 RepID=A0A0E9U8G3_ANGAN
MLWNVLECSQSPRISHGFSLLHSKLAFISKEQLVQESSADKSDNYFLAGDDICWLFCCV